MNPWRVIEALALAACVAAFLIIGAYAIAAYAASGQ